MAAAIQRVLSILAHPDDAEFLCAGTMIRLREIGWDVHIATMTPGDCGSRELPSEEISRIRMEEARAAAAKIDGTYHCLDSRDLLVCFDAAHIRRTVELIRRVDPTVVVTHSPQDYMLDHEVTSMLARTACFGAPVPNFKVAAAPSDRIPYLYYCSPIEGKNLFGEPVPQSVVIDVSNVMELKSEMLDCHTSQRDWLKAQHGMDEYGDSMKRWATEVGRGYGVQYAEAFRQHRGHAYPQQDLLGDLLGNKSATASRL